MIPQVKYNNYFDKVDGTTGIATSIIKVAVTASKNGLFVAAD